MQTQHQHITDVALLHPLIAGTIIAVIAGVVGCFVVWRRMAYFGDSLAHSSLLGIALGMATGLSDNLGVVISASLFALLLLSLEHYKILASDTLMGLLAHASLSVGVIAISLLNRHDDHGSHGDHDQHQHIDIHAFLFGDIMTVGAQDLYWMGAGGALVLLLAVRNWSSLLLVTIHEDLARAEGVRVLFARVLLMMLMAIVVAASIQVVGILLIASLLLIPPASARQLARSPEAMALIAVLIGIVSVFAGVFAGTEIDLPVGPSIVAFSSIIFVVLLPIVVLENMRKNKVINHPARSKSPRSR